MLSIFKRLIQRIQFRQELINLLSFFIGIFSSSAMITFIIHNYYQLAILAALIAWLSFSLLFKRYEKIICRSIISKLLTDYDSEKIENVLKIIHKQNQN